jgi:hypothetical protein
MCDSRVAMTSWAAAEMGLKSLGYVSCVSVGAGMDRRHYDMMD